MQLEHLNVLAQFLTIAEERSFTKAAKRLGVSRSALSHAVRGLEERLGVRLLDRTTRSVAPTEAGMQLISRLRPALGDVESVLGEIVGGRERPTGRVRLLVTPLSPTMVLAPKLASFAAIPGRRPRDHDDAGGSDRSGRRRLRGRDSLRRIDPARHGGRACVSRSAPGGGRVAGVLRVASDTRIAARFAEPSMHQSACGFAAALRVGVRERR